MGNLINSLKQMTKFDRIYFVSPYYKAPPITSFMSLKGTILYVNIKDLSFDSKNQIINLEALLDHGALAVSNENAFKNRNLLKNVPTFSFFFDIKSRYFLMTDVFSRTDNATILGGLKMLKESHVLNTRLDIIMKGAFGIDNNGEATKATVTLYNEDRKLAEDKISMRALFYITAMGFNALGFSANTVFFDMVHPLKSLMNFLKNDGIASLGDIVKKYHEAFQLRTSFTDPVR